MTALPPRHETEPSLPNLESLFPLPANTITEVRNRLLRVTDDDINSFVGVRRDGRPDDVTTTLLNTGFAQWHIEHGDFSGERSVLMYSAGKLYGAQMALERYSQITGQPLLADDGDAYEVAKFSVYESYRGLEAPTQWEQDFKREQRVTGGKTLAILNAALHDHTLKQFEAMYGDAIPEEEALETFYTGLLDASIFMQAYALYRDSNVLLPVLQYGLHQTPEIPSIVTEIHADMRNKSLFGVEIQLESDNDNLKQVLENVDPKPEEIKSHITIRKDKMYVFDTAPVLTQTGPNNFTFDERVLAVSEALIPKDLRIRRALGYGAVGGSATLLPDIFGSQSIPWVTVASMVIAGAGVASIAWNTLPARVPKRVITRSLWSEKGYTPNHEGVGHTSLQIFS
ncbi:MAG: hypothetical protein WAS36_03755 [Candidatus Saccharimonadales bacterium]